MRPILNKLSSYQRRLKIGKNLSCRSWHDNNTLHFAFVTLLTLFCSFAIALPNDSKQLIHITADSSQFDYKKGINLYEGNVKIDQGTTRVTADRVTTRNNIHHKIEEAIAYGLKKPAVYTTTLKTGDLLFEAKSDVIKYYPLKSTIVLEGNAQVSQGENSFHGPVIIYNMKDELVTAPASNIGRAMITIKPEQKK